MSTLPATTVPDPIVGLTKEEFMCALPKQVKGKVHQEHIDHVNQLLLDPELRESFRDNLLSYGSVMAEGKYKMQDYINAVKFVSFKLLGSTNQEAYIKTFPQRYARLLRENTPDSTISSFSSNYNKNQLVNKIYEQTLVPSYILNADVFQKAINRQAHLMIHARSEKVQSDAANSLMHHLKKPEGLKIDLNVGIKEDTSIDELRKSTMALVAEQKRVLESGVFSAKEIAHSRITEGEVFDVEPDA